MGLRSLGEKGQLVLFLAVQNSSIGDLVTQSLTDSLRVPFTFEIHRATLETCDL